MTVLHIPSHGVLINGLVYQPSGPGPHPTLIICHGLPGNEKNLDLAQAVVSDKDRRQPRLRDLPAHVLARTR